MKLTTVVFARDSLASNIARNLIGDRVLDLTESLGTDEGGNIVGQVFNFGKKLVGFVIGALTNFVQWSFSELWDLIVEAYFEIKYFDWNQTDAEIKTQLEQNDSIIASSLGRLAGTGLVWLTGITVSVGLSFKFPVLAGRVALELAEEGGQEIRSAVSNLIIASRNVAIQNVLLGGLLTARRYRLFGQEPVNREKKPWTFAERVEEKIESISSSKLRSFANSFVDAIEDSIIEMGYVIAYTLDDFYESSRRANSNILGQERTVIITPDTRVEDEQIIIEAPQELVIANTQSLLANHQLIYNRDLGQIVGSPEEDYFSPTPQRRKLKIIFRSKEKPPWRHSDGNYSKKVECSIPDVKPGLTWSKLKRGIPSFTWGKYRVTAYLDNGRQMTVYGVSYAEAEQQIRILMQLSTANIMNLTGGEGITDIPTRRKLPTLVYPVYAKLMEGDITTSGRWRSNKRKTTRIDLWVDSEPEDLAEIL